MFQQAALFWQDEGGNFIEESSYNFFIVITVIAVITLLGPKIAGVFQSVVDAI